MVILAVFDIYRMHVASVNDPPFMMIFVSAASDSLESTMRSPMNIPLFIVNDVFTGLGTFPHTPNSTLPVIVPVVSTVTCVPAE